MGYSGTPLAKKLGIKDGYSIQVFNTPQKYMDFFENFPANVNLVPEGIFAEQIDFIHLFATNYNDLEEYPRNTFIIVKILGTL